MNCCSNTPKQNSTKRKSVLILNAQGRHGKAWSVDKDRIFANALSFWWKENEGAQHCHRCPNYRHSLQRVHIGRQQSKTSASKFMYPQSTRLINEQKSTDGRKEYPDKPNRRVGRKCERNSQTGAWIGQSEASSIHERTQPQITERTAVTATPTTTGTKNSKKPTRRNFIEHTACRVPALRSKKLLLCSPRRGNSNES
jgi:hypothetical protein